MLIKHFLHRLLALMTFAVLSVLTGCSTAAGVKDIDDDTLNQLTVAGPMQLRPGESATFVLGTYCCGSEITPMEIDAFWSLSPENGAKIDAQSGILRVSRSTPHGTVYTVSANIENGRRMISVMVHVFTDKENPFVDWWVESSQLLCNSYESIPIDPFNDSPIEELSFYADNTFSVTWHGIEAYRDYWGIYTYDLARGTLELSVIEGNYVPEEIDGIGTFSVEQDETLVVEDIWLGNPPNKSIPVHCGYIFSRFDNYYK